MPLKYANPEEVKNQAYQYYQLCVDKHNRTGHTKDYVELVRARKDYQAKSQYARIHKVEAAHELPSLEASKSLLIEHQANQITSLQKKNTQLRRGLSAANEVIAGLVDTLERMGLDTSESKEVDKRRREVITNLKKLTPKSNGE